MPLTFLIRIPFTITGTAKVNVFSTFFDSSFTQSQNNGGTSTQGAKHFGIYVQAVNSPAGDKLYSHTLAYGCSHLISEVLEVHRFSMTINEEIVIIFYL